MLQSSANVAWYSAYPVIELYLLSSIGVVTIFTSPPFGAKPVSSVLPEPEPDLEGTKLSDLPVLSPLVWLFGGLKLGFG